MITGRSALTDRQRELLRFIEAEHTVTYRAAMDGVRMSHTQFKKHIKLLDERGFIVRGEGLVRLVGRPGV